MRQSLTGAHASAEVPLIQTELPPRTLGVQFVFLTLIQTELSIVFLTLIQTELPPRTLGVQFVFLACTGCAGACAAFVVGVLS